MDVDPFFGLGGGGGGGGDTTTKRNSVLGEGVEGGIPPPKVGGLLKN